MKQQHGVVARRQLVQIGLTPKAIRHRMCNGRLHPISRGVYAVGRPQLTGRGHWMAAVLCCGPQALLSHQSAAALWGIHPLGQVAVEVSVPAHQARSRPGLIVHRRVAAATTQATRCDGIPVTTPILTLVDLAMRLRRNQLEAAINEADKRELIDVERLRAGLGVLAGLPGAGVLRTTLDRRTFTFTESELERRFLPIARTAGLPRPQTGRWVNGFKTDFHWPELELVVETDGLRYHRTPSQQARDRLRDQTHTAAGLAVLRFTHAQIRFEPDHVEATLVAVARRRTGQRRVR